MESLKEHKGTVFLSVMTAIIEVALGILPYFATAKIINLIIAEKREMRLYLPFLIVILTGLLGSVVFHGISTLISHNLAYKIIEEKRKRVVRHLEKISMVDLEKKSSGQWKQFIVETLDRIEQPIAHVIPEVFANVLIPVVITGIIFSLDMRMGIANLVSIPLGAVFSLLMMRGYKEKSQRYLDASKDMHTGMVEYVKGIQVIKAFNRSASSFQRFRECVRENRDAMLEWYLSVCFSITASQEILPSGIVVVLPLGLYLLKRGQLDSDIFVMCILLSYACYKPLLKAMGYSETLANISVVNEEIEKVMHLGDMPRGNVFQKVSDGKVEFDNVVFAYEKGKDVLDGLSFTAEENSLTAIVGNSGCGKSTVAKLLAGFQNPDSGSVSIGGACLREMPLMQNMNLVTYVSQDSFLFDRSIMENLILAKEDATEGEVYEACKKASVHDFIMRLPDGYQTRCGEGGAIFSGGEKQRIAIARCFLKDSPVILLDEATAYSDPDNERVIQQAIDRLVKNKTVIMIAHRLGTIKDADKIVVMDHGKVIEQGTHEEMTKREGPYYRMWEAYRKMGTQEVM